MCTLDFPLGLGFGAGFGFGYGSPFTFLGALHSVDMCPTFPQLKQVGLDCLQLVAVWPFLPQLKQDSKNEEEAPLVVSPLVCGGL